MKALRELGPWLALAVLVWAGGLALQRLRPREPAEALTPWQHSFRELDDAEQRTFRHLREALLDLERARVTLGRWPTPDELSAVEPFREDERTPSRQWTVRTHGVYASYLGLPRADGQRWLVLFIEPSTTEQAPPEDEEHHTLPDGRGVHVTVWTQANDEPAPGDEVLAFPAAEKWVQRVGR